VSEQFAIDDVMLHRGAMQLLTGLGEYSEAHMTAYVRVSEDSSFFEPGYGVPVWIGIEYMAQAIAVHGGIRAREAGRPIPLGLLIGCHNFSGNVTYFVPDDELTIEANELVADADGLGAFDCAITGSDIEVRARLTVFVSADANLDEVIRRNRSRAQDGAE